MHAHGHAHGHAHTHPHTSPMAHPHVLESYPALPFRVFVNGRKVVLPTVNPEWTLLYFLRNELGLTGTKLGCAEGGCGACTVMVSHFDRLKKKVVHRAVNACLAPICSVHDMAVTTIEGIGSTKTRLHPVQERMAKAHGSQCGFCTPGIVMSMYTLLRNNPHPTMEEIESAFEGNLCRCTGYRPILAGFHTFAKERTCEKGKDCCQNQGNANASASEGCGMSGGCCQSKLPNNNNNNNNNNIMAGDGGCCQGKGAGEGCCKAGGDGDGVAAIAKEENVKVGLVDASKFLPYDPSQEPIFPPELMLETTKPLHSVAFIGERVQWFTPATLDEVLELKHQHPHARIVVGNTEVGIEVKFKHQRYHVCISPINVPELNTISTTDTEMVIGASATLSDVQQALDDLIRTLDPSKTWNLQAMQENLRWFAGKQIRNVACVGGNIVTASPISDLNPIFVASGAHVRVTNRNGHSRSIPVREFFLSYRKTALQHEEVLVSIHVPFTRPHEYTEAYKVARRKDDDIALVNGCMRVLLTEQSPGVWAVKEAYMAFGGMGPITVTAKATEIALLGKVWDNSIVDVAAASLAQDLHLTSDAVGGKVQFRRATAASLFFKFFLTVCNRMKLPVDQRLLSAIQRTHRPVSEATQIFEAPLDNTGGVDLVGKPLAHVAAEKQSTGEAIYTDDIPKYKNEVYGAFVFSTHAHAKIISVDATTALKMHGVHAFISAKDVKGTNVIGPVVHDEDVFAAEKVTCVGQAIGVIVADTQAQAQEAARAVKVVYEPLPAVITIEQAIAANSFYPNPHTIAKGNTAEGFAQSDHVLSGEVRMGGQEHFYLETQACVCVPKGEDGEIEIFTSSQNISHSQHLIAEVLGVPSNRVVCRVKRLGGGFGGKETRSIYVAAAMAVAAQNLGRPVRCMLDRNEDMISSGGRHPFLAKYKVGFTKDGRIQALEIDMYSNAGNSHDLSIPVMDRALFHMDNVYKIPNIRGTGYVCRTNIRTNTAFRGFGGPQGMFMVEQWMTDVARMCKLPQDKVREINFYQEGDLTHFNQKLEGCQIQSVWTETQRLADYSTRRAAVDDFNKANRFRKRGLALIPTKFGIAFTATFMNQSGALVQVYTDGSVLLAHGGTEMGQGLHTKMIQVAARALGVPISQVHISETSTVTVPNTSPTAASASSDLNGMAVLNACNQIMERLKPYREKMPDKSFNEWVNAAYFDRVSLSAAGFYATPDLGYSFEKNEGRPFNYFCYGSACVETEIDTLTGEMEVLRADLVMDVGASLNPAIDIGQVEGAFVQGLGLFCMEEEVWLNSGALVSTGPGAYKLPGFKDIPTKFNVSLLRNAPNPRAVHSSKAVGEPPLFLGSAVFFAVKDAVTAAREEEGIDASTIFRMDSPCTVDRVRMACADRFTKQFPDFPAGAPTWNVVA